MRRTSKPTARGTRHFVALSLCMGVAGCTLFEGDPPTTDGGAGRVPIVVLGDSDSHGYRDDVLGTRRGGAYHDQTFQWTEILARIRPTEVDLGPVAPWGQRGIFALLRDNLGVPARTPRKNDFLYDFAVSGATCATLDQQWPRQVRWAISRIREQPNRWASGLIVIKIGINDFGALSELGAFAAAGITLEATEAIEVCAGAVRRAVGALREVTPAAVIVVGIADESAWPEDVVPDWTPEEVARIRKALATFDERVAGAVADIESVAFMDDRAWYYERWPDRDDEGRAQSGGVSLGGPRLVMNTVGDHPANLVLDDGHAGTVANGFWARTLVRAANDAFGFGLTPISDAEIADLADLDRSIGIATSDPMPTRPPRIVAPYERLVLGQADLPFSIGPVEAEDEFGADIGASAVAYLESADGVRSWLYGGGDDLRIDGRRHSPGEYRLVVAVRDRANARAEVAFSVQIRGQ